MEFMIKLLAVIFLMLADLSWARIETNIPHNIAVSDLASLGISYHLQPNHESTAVSFLMPEHDPCEQHYVYALVPLNDLEYQEVEATVMGKVQSLIIDSKRLRDTKFFIVCDSNSYNFKFI